MELDLLDPQKQIFLSLTVLKSVFGGTGEVQLITWHARVVVIMNPI